MSGHADLEVVMVACPAPEEQVEGPAPDDIPRHSRPPQSTSCLVRAPGVPPVEIDLERLGQAVYAGTAVTSGWWRCSSSQRCASRAAIVPDPAAVTAWRYV